MSGWRDAVIHQDKKGRLIKDESVPTIRHKFNAKPTVVDNLWFASKLEAHFYELLRRDDSILFFLRQVPFHLPEKEKYVVDFVVFKKDGTVRFLDVKGMVTRDFSRKKVLVEKYYPVTIEVVKKGKWS